ncbi:MAG: SpoIID/LytB domain-containing protein [Endomicrobiia bacterium]
MTKNFLKSVVIILIGYLIFTINTQTFAQQNVLEIRKNYLEGKITNIDEIENLEFQTEEENIIKNLTLFEFYIDKKNIEQALQYANYLSSFFPVNQLVNYRLAEYYYNLKNYEKSIKYFEECVKNDSRFHEARNLLANTYYTLKDYQKALRHYNVLSWFKSDKKIITKLEYLSSQLGYNGITNLQKTTNFSNIYTSTLTINSPYIKVGVSTKDNGNLMRIDAVKFYFSNDFEIYDDKNKKILFCKGGIDNEWTIVYRTQLKSFGVILNNERNKEIKIKSQYITIKPLSENSTFIIKEYKWFKTSFFVNKEFRGEIIIRHLKDQIVVINNIKIDEYLYSVIAKEIGKDKPEEALKTQAIVARNVALYRKHNNVHKYFDVCCGQHCQVYDGTKSETEQTINAVDKTIGEVITYNDKIVHTFFHANCGGITSCGEKFFCNKEYLQPTYDTITQQSDDETKNYEIKNFYYWYLTPPRLLCKDSYFVHPGVSRWIRIIKKDELKKFLNSKFSTVGKLKDIIILSREDNGYIKKIKIVGSDKTIILNKEHKIRNIVANSLKSSSFIIEYNKNNDCYYFWGAGWGHGVGMCQSGVCGLAENGKNYTEIIQHYFRNTEIKKLY